MLKLRFTAKVAVLIFIGLQTQAGAQILGTADTFAVLGGQTVTNTGPTLLSGNLGVSPGTAITGFPPGLVVNGTTYLSGAIALQAQSDVTTAYNFLAAQSFNQSLTGQDLGGMSLVAGVYRFSSSAFLTGMLTLNAQGNPNARWIFQIGSTLITSSASSVHVINGGDGCNVYWKVGSSATIGTTTAFAGHIVALTDIDMLTGATILEGSALARNGEVRLDTNTIMSCGAVPEPVSILALSTGLLALAARRRKAGGRHR